MYRLRHRGLARRRILRRLSRKSRSVALCTCGSILHLGPTPSRLFFLHARFLHLRLHTVVDRLRHTRGLARSRILQRLSRTSRYMLCSCGSILHLGPLRSSQFFLPAHLHRLLTAMDRGLNRRRILRRLSRTSRYILCSCGRILHLGPAPFLHLRLHTAVDRLQQTRGSRILRRLSPATRYVGLCSCGRILHLGRSSQYFHRFPMVIVCKPSGSITRSDLAQRLQMRLQLCQCTVHSLTSCSLRIRSGIFQLLQLCPESPESTRKRARRSRLAQTLYPFRDLCEGILHFAGGLTFGCGLFETPELGAHPPQCVRNRVAARRSLLSSRLLPFPPVQLRLEHRKLTLQSLLCLQCSCLLPCQLCLKLSDLRLRPRFFGSLLQ
eukprot:Hpha_TRINITY_DN15967_c2_g1::TRINITY_DN15967_c2_g1_i4::g.70548::m.70548